MQNLTQIFNKPLLQPLIQKIQHIQQLNQNLNEVLSGDLKKHCRVAGLEGTCLILQVDSGAWATRLRYETPELLRALQTHKDFARIESIRWQVRI